MICVVYTVYSNCICVSEYSLEKASSQQSIFCVLLVDACWWAWQCQVSFVVCEKNPIVLACTSVFIENMYTISMVIDKIFFIHFGEVKYIFSIICFELFSQLLVFRQSLYSFFFCHWLSRRLQNNNSNVSPKAVDLYFLINQLLLGCTISIQYSSFSAMVMILSSRLLAFLNAMSCFFFLSFVCIIYG